MSIRRVFDISEHLQPSDDEPIRSIVQETPDATIVAWIVRPGQCIAPHVHPHGQDTWTLLSGEGHYQTDEAGTTVRIATGDVVVASRGEVHGVRNTGSQPLVFISVVCPLEAGYRLLPSMAGTAPPFIGSSGQT